MHSEGLQLTYSASSLRQVYSWLMVNVGRLFASATVFALFAFPWLKGLAAGYMPVLFGIAIGAALLSPVFRARLIAAIEWPQRLTFVGSVMVLAMCLRLGAVLFFPKEPMVDDAQFHHYAQSMAGGGPYGTTAYRAFFPPGMSLLLTPFYFLFGADPLVGKALNVVLGSASVLVLYEIGLLIGSVALARFAAVFAAVLPTSVFYSATLGYEIALGLVLELIYLLLMVDIATANRGFVRLSLMGVLSGAGCLLKPVCLLIPIILAICWWANTGKLIRSSRALWVAIVMFGVIAPWTYRNYRVFGEFVLISTNGGIVLCSANNPEATGLAMHVRPAIGEVGEVERNRICGRKARDWIVTHPFQSADLMWRKVAYTWGTSSSIMSVISTDRVNSIVESACKALLNVSWTVLVLFCAYASFKTDIWSRSGFAFPCMLLAYFFSLHLFYEALSRHHVPVIFSLLLIASEVLSRSPDRLGSRTSARAATVT